MGAWGTGLYSDDFALDVKIDLLSAIKGNIKMDKIDRAMLLKMMDDDQDQETQNQAVDLAKKDENIEF